MKRWNSRIEHSCQWLSDAQKHHPLNGGQNPERVDAMTMVMEMEMEMEMDTYGNGINGDGDGDGDGDVCRW